MASSADTHDGISHFEQGDTFDEAVGEQGIVLVDFYADWCGPCKQMEPVLDAVAETTEARILKVDVDRHQELSSQHQVRGVPTLLVYKNGEQVERFVGYQSEPALKETIEQLSD